MYPNFNLPRYLSELLRPWKLIALSIALSYYIWGVYYYKLPTWDVPVSIIMSILTYLFSPFVVKTLFYLYKKRPSKWFKKLLTCIVITYLCASGSYEGYHMVWGIGYHPPTYLVNLYYSTLIFLAAGMFWKFEGTFTQLLTNLKVEFSKAYHKNKILTVGIWIILIILFILLVIHSLQVDWY